MSTQRTVHVIWCDDVRQEIGNKLSHMGVYGGVMVHQSIPTKLPKLCAVINVLTPIERPFEALRLRVIRNDMPDAPVAQIEVSPPALSGALAGAEADQNSHTLPGDDPMTVLGLNFVLMMGPIDITDQTRWLRVQVDTGAELVESLKLRMSVQSNERGTPAREGRP